MQGCEAWRGRRRGRKATPQGELGMDFSTPTCGLTRDSAEEPFSLGYEITLKALFLGMAAGRCERVELAADIFSTLGC